MELILLDHNFETIGFVDSFLSLIWTRRYCEPGCFELHARLGDFPLFQRTAYVCCKAFAETGVVEGAGYTVDGSSRRAYLKGRFLEALLDNRAVSAETTLAGSADGVILQLVQRFSGLQLACEPAAGFGEPITTQVTGGSLLERVYDIARPAGLSVRLRYDYVSGSMSFGVWRGLDRTEDQADNSRAVFSDSFENIRTANYERNVRDWRNFAYVAGEGEGAQRVVVTVDETGSNPRRELWVDARDLQKKEMTDGEYAAALRQRGREKLAEYLPVQKAQAEVRAGANLRYGTDYDLGDLCTYVDAAGGVTVSQRITEATEVYENNRRAVSLTFGEDSKTVRQILKREVN